MYVSYLKPVDEEEPWVPVRYAGVPDIGTLSTRRWYDTPISTTCQSLLPHVYLQAKPEYMRGIPEGLCGMFMNYLESTQCKEIRLVRGMVASTLMSSDYD
jgi:hypothetical protein